MAIASVDVYNTLIDLIRADKRGLTLSVDEYNRLARIVNERVYAKYYADFEKNVANIDTMGGFKVLNTTVNLVAGVGSLPSDYYELIGRPHYVDNNNVTRYLDLVTTLELVDRYQDYLTQPTATHPVCMLGQTDNSGDLEINVFPITITSIHVDYLKVAATPFLDYYVNDTTLVYTFLTDGQTLINVPAGSTYRDGTAGAVVIANSQTTDWEWGDSDFSLILALFAQFIGITLPDQFLVETGVVNEEKS